MQSENRITLIPDSASYAAVQSFLEQRLDEAAISLRVPNRIQVSADSLFLRFTDNGKPYDPTAVPEPDTTLSAEERQIGGLGLHMVRKMTRAMVYAYENGESRLTLTFDLQ